MARRNGAARGEEVVDNDPGHRRFGRGGMRAGALCVAARRSPGEAGAPQAPLMLVLLAAADLAGGVFGRDHLEGIHRRP